MKGLKTTSCLKKLAWWRPNQKYWRRAARTALSAKTEQSIGCFFLADTPAYAMSAWSISNSAPCAGSLWGSHFHYAARESDPCQRGSCVLYLSGTLWQRIDKPFSCWFCNSVFDLTFPSTWMMFGASKNYEAAFLFSLTRHSEAALWRPMT